MRSKLAVVALSVSLAASTATVHAAKKAGSPVTLDAEQIEQLTGAKGTLDKKQNVFKVTVPRSDLSVTVGSIKLSPSMGLTSWAAFNPGGDQMMVMGDMVLTEDQVNPVMSVALDNGLAVTALHSHFAWDEPRIRFMHIEAMGAPDQLATAVGKVFEKIKQTAGSRGEMPKADIDPAKSSFDAKKLDEILNRKGGGKEAFYPSEFKDGVYKIVYQRLTELHGHQLGDAMGVNTWAAFAGSEDSAVVDGDFAVKAEELQDVLKVLRGAGIDIVAIHNHMLGEQPRIVFLHYIGVGKAQDLAKALSAALDKTHTT